MIMILTATCYFLLLLLIAFATGRNRQDQTDAAFFRANNRSPWYVVAFGMIGASISGVTFVSVPGMVRSLDMTYMQTVAGFFFGYIAVAHVLLPLYYRLNLTSIYTFLEMRLGTRAYRTGAFFFLLSRMTGTAAKLYLVCLILHTYVFAGLGIPFVWIAAGAVILVWLYTWKSGLRTIVWTDTLQTFCLIAALVSIIVFVMQNLGLDSAGAVWETVRNSPHSRMFVWDDWVSKQHFIKQFLSGIFIVIVMTGLDQDMMQKNLTCRTLREAQKNMYAYGFAFIPLNLLFLTLGVLLLTLATQEGIGLPAVNDDILPFFATQGYLGDMVTVLFSIGIIAAAFSNADSALTAMTTSVCIDWLHTEQRPEKEATAIRFRVHLLLSGVLIALICMVRAINNPSVLDVIFIIASYTYGPLLGMFAFGLLCPGRADDRQVPWIAVAAPLLCYLTDRATALLWDYRFGYELLMLNGLLTFGGIWLTSARRKQTDRKYTAAGRNR